MVKFGKTVEVELAGEKGTFTTEARVDTGAARTTVDHNLAATVGAGPIIKTVKVTSSTGSDRRPVAKILIKYGEFEEEISVGLADRKSQEMDYMMIIGRDVLSHDDITVDI